MMKTMTFAEELQEIRLDRGITKAAHAREMGIAYRTYRDWAKGNKTPACWRFIIKGLIIESIERQCNISYEDLLILTRALSTGKKYMGAIEEVNGEMDVMDEALDIVGERLRGYTIRNAHLSDQLEI